MPAHNILVVVVDGLRASALGTYGNTSFLTPALDRFAAESFLLDWCYARSAGLASIYRDLWRLNTASLPQQLKPLGFAATLVTDEPVVAAFPAAADFDNHLQLSDSHQGSDATRKASEVGGTALARLFATAADVVVTTAADSAQFVWLHSRGMYGPWDAPLELQQSLLDDSDPPPVEEVAPPDFLLAAGDDPDVAFRYSCAYAAQVMVLDECWETLLDAVDTAGAADRWLVTLLGARGYPLGEHRRVGGIDQRLYGEQLHVPWLIRFSDAAGRLARSNQLTTHADLAASLITASEDVSIRTLATAARAPWRNALIAKSPDGHRAIRTGGWCLRQSPSIEFDAATSAPGEAVTSDIELFVRPDDRWEANDVAKLCTDVVESLTGRLNEPA